MSNPVQHLLEAFNGIYANVSKLSYQRSNQPSTSLNKNDNSLASLSSHSAGVLILFTPSETCQNKSFPDYDERRTWEGHLDVSSHSCCSDGHIFSDVSLQGMCGSLQRGINSNYRTAYRLDLTANSLTGYATFIMLLIKVPNA